MPKRRNRERQSKKRSDVRKDDSRKLREQLKGLELFLLCHKEKLHPRLEETLTELLLILKLDP
jgi:hypothetical protein